MTTAQTHLFRFTPSMMPPETLEQLLVQRQTLAQRLIDVIRESVTTQNKHHKLLVGPRGMGKTHLVALTYYRIKAMSDLRENLWIAWLNEEEWGVDSFLDLLLRICRALQAEYPSLFPSERMEALYQMTQAEAQRAAELLLKEFIGDRTLVLLMENLDELFKGIGDNGQRQFRSFLQENAFSTILATSQSLFNGVSRQTSPFFGFFSVTHLQEFSVEDATHLLKNIAEWKQDKALVDFIQTPAGRARVRTVNHLAGGNPRLYVIFSEFLTRDSLDELVEPFMRTLDELTPYYQSRIGALSTQQRKMIEFLCDHVAPATVKEIAQRCFMSQQTASGQLKDLKDKGYVLPDPLGPTGRDTYYELKEPLMRLCLEVKKSRGGPIRLLVDFLRLWYPISELRRQLDLCKPEHIMEKDYLVHRGVSLWVVSRVRSTLGRRPSSEALQCVGAHKLPEHLRPSVLVGAIDAAEKETDPRIKQCVLDYIKTLKCKDYDEALQIAEELLSLQPTASAYRRRAEAFFYLKRYQDAVDDLDKSIHLVPQNALAWVNRGRALKYLGQYEEAIKSLETAVRIQPKEVSFWHYIADIHSECGRYKEAVSVLEKALTIPSASANTWIKHGNVLNNLHCHVEALDSFTQAIKMENCFERAWTRRAWTLKLLGRLEEALLDCNAALQCNPLFATAWHYKGQILYGLKRYQESTTCFLKSIEFRPDYECPEFDLTAALFAMHDFSDGISRLTHVLQHHANPKVHVAWHTKPILDNLFEALSDTDQWKDQIALITQLYIQHSLESALAISLSQHIKSVVAPSVPIHIAKKWYVMWNEAAHRLPSFELPLRLLDISIRYRATNDKRILLELPSEERKILASLLKEAGIPAVIKDEPVG